MKTDAFSRRSRPPYLVQIMDLPWRPVFRGLAARRLPSPSPWARLELELRFLPLPVGSLPAKIIYSTDRFTEQAINVLF
jgi:hypothetical protein